MPEAGPDPIAAFLELSEEERDAIVDAMEPAAAAELLARLETFLALPIRQFLDELYPAQILPPHVQPIIDAFSASRFERQFVIVEMPARHAKTETLLRCLAWFLRKYPTVKNGYASYSDTQAWDVSELARRYAAMAGIETRGAKRLWLTEQGGGLIAAGVGGGLIGKGIGGWLIVDDPYPNPMAAESRAYNAMLRSWFKQVAFTRSEGASVLLQHHRWSPDDLIGWAMREFPVNWTRIKLPALAEYGDLLGRAPGEALWPGNPLWTREEMLKIQTIVGEYVWATMYQQNPQPKGTKLFAEHVVTFTMADHLAEQRAERGKWRRVVIGADPAASKNQRSDHSAAVVLAFTGAADKLRARVLEVMRGHYTIPDFSRRLFGLSQRWNAPVYVEAVGGFKAIPDLLREWVPRMPVHEAPVRGDKFLRAQGASAAWNTGRIEVLAGASWVDEFLQELYLFTGAEGGEDDQVDALAHGWNGVAGVPDYVGQFRELANAV